MTWFGKIARIVIIITIIYVIGLVTIIAIGAQINDYNNYSAREELRDNIFYFYISIGLWFIVVIWLGFGIYVAIKYL